MSELQVTARIPIKAGELQQFEALAAACIRVARELDSGTLQYDWFINADKSECVVRERYRDSAAALEHVANLGEETRLALGEANMRLEICGAASQALIDATSGPDTEFFDYFAGL